MAINLGVNAGISLPAAAAIPLGVLSLLLLLYLRRTGGGRDIGLGTPSAASPARMWFYLPLLALVAFPLVTGLREDMTPFIVAAVAAWALFGRFSRKSPHARHAAHRPAA